jgi:DNA-directed RNA polymerase specialized sigma24 family protein
MTDRLDRPDENEVARPRPGAASISDRIAAFTMLEGMKDATQAEKIYRLSLVGFTTLDISRMLQTTPGNVRQAVYDRKRKASRRPGPKKASRQASSD